MNPFTRPRSNFQWWIIAGWHGAWDGIESATQYQII